MITSTLLIHFAHSRTSKLSLKRQEKGGLTVRTTLHTIPFDEVVGSRRGGIVTALHGEQDVPTSHARDLVRHGLRRSAFRAVDTAFSARHWPLLQAAQSRQAGLAFACGADRTQRQPHAEDLLVLGNVQHSAVSHRQHR